MRFDWRPAAMAATIGVTMVCLLMSGCAMSLRGDAINHVEVGKVGYFDDTDHGEIKAPRDK